MNDTYEFIEAEKDARADADAGALKYTITKMCGWLGVSTSGFYEWRDRVESATAKRRELLSELAQKAFDDSKETYGHRRVHAQLLRWGQRCTPELVRRIMRDLRLVPCQPRPRRNLTQADAAAGPIPDLVNRDFTADAPGQKMVGSGGRGELHPPAPTE